MTTIEAPPKSSVSNSLLAQSQMRKLKRITLPETSYKTSTMYDTVNYLRSMTQEFMAAGEKRERQFDPDILVQYVVHEDGELLAECLEDGANPNLRNEDGITPLFEACINSNAGLARLLLHYKADPNVACADDGRTPLSAAIMNRNVSMIKILLSKEADPNVPNAKGETPLFTSCFYGLEEITMILLNARGDPRIRNEAGLSPTEVASYHLRPRLEQAAEYLKILEMDNTRKEIEARRKPKAFYSF